jgi:hypothetical protein
MIARGREPSFSAMAAIVNLNHHATYIHWHFITLSLSNVIVIAVMLVVFAAAILLPFPKHRETGSQT